MFTRDDDIEVAMHLKVGLTAVDEGRLRLAAFSQRRSMTEIAREALREHLARLERDRDGGSKSGA